MPSWSPQDLQGRRKNNIILLITLSALALGIFFYTFLYLGPDILERRF